MDDSDILVKKQARSAEACVFGTDEACRVKKKVDQQLQDKALINRGIWTVAGKDSKSGSRQSVER